MIHTQPPNYPHSIAESSKDAVLSALKVDTDNLPKPHLECLIDLVMNVVLLEAEKPTQAENEFEGVALDGHGQLVIENARYNTRVRRSRQVRLSLLPSTSVSFVRRLLRQRVLRASC